MLSKLVELLLSLFKTYKTGDAMGNSPSPRVRIDWADVKYDKDTKTLSIKNIEPEVRITTVQNTNSMENLLDVGHIVVTSNNSTYVEELGIGDVIIWDKDGGQTIHMIVDMDRDEQGWYCITQGINIPRKDPEKIRLADIKEVVLMVIWCEGEGYYRANVGD